MSTNGVAQVAVLSFGLGIAIGLAMITLMSVGIQNAKRRRGGKYSLQVLGLLLSLAWTMYFLWKMAEATGATRIMQAQGARMSDRLMGRTGGGQVTNMGTSAVV